MTNLTQYIKTISTASSCFLLSSCGALKGDNKINAGNFITPDNVVQTFQQTQEGSILSPEQLIITFLVLSFISVIIGIVLTIAYFTLKRKYTAPLGLALTLGGLIGTYGLAISAIWWFFI